MSQIQSSLVPMTCTTTIRYGPHTWEIRPRALSTTDGNSKLQESELDRFMADNTLNTFVTVMKNGKPYKQTLVYEPLRWWRERGEHL
jgi:hypothetical protein